MSQKITIKFNYARRFSGYNAAGGYTIFTSELDTEYYVKLDVDNERYVRLTWADGFYTSFYHPGVSDSYTLVREGWDEIDPPDCIVTPPVVPKPAKPILESTLIMTIEPTQHSSSVTHTEYLIYKLPRVLNGLLVDRGRCDQETVADRANVEAVGELRGVASFMLTSRNNHLRYQCVSFRIDNLTTKKNLTSQYGCASVRSSE